MLLKLRGQREGCYINQGFLKNMLIDKADSSEYDNETFKLQARALYVSVCQSRDIRNSVDQFSQLEGCRVIEGFLQIVLIDKADSSEYDNLTFPELREVTGYVLLYRVNGLRSLGRLFPNLAVIRGNELFFDYALVAFEMLHLQVC